jgi:hypothetical protein
MVLDQISLGDESDAEEENGEEEAECEVTEAAPEADKCELFFREVRAYTSGTCAEAGCVRATSALAALYKSTDV